MFKSCLVKHSLKLFSWCEWGIISVLKFRIIDVALALRVLLVLKALHSKTRSYASSWSSQAYSSGVLRLAFRDSENQWPLEQLSKQNASTWQVEEYLPVASKVLTADFLHRR